MKRNQKLAWRKEHYEVNTTYSFNAATGKPIVGCKSIKKKAHSPLMVIKMLRNAAVKREPSKKTVINGFMAF